MFLLRHLKDRTLVPGARRWHTVLAWGRNLEGQAGVEGQVVVTRPSVVMELHGRNLVGVSASKLTSAVVTADGQVYTWGDGWGGKLGHGNGDALGAPARVESLVDRVHVTQVALGDHHTVMCDEHGHVWACGENKEVGGWVVKEYRGQGQCGLGTPLDVIAQQRNLAYYRAASGGNSNHSSRHLMPESLREELIAAKKNRRTNHEFVRHTPSAGHGQENPGAAFTRRLRALIRQQDSDQARKSSDRQRSRRGAAAGALWATHQHQTVMAAAGMAPGAAAAVTAAAAGGGAKATVAGSGEGGSFSSWGSSGWLVSGGPAGALTWGGSDLTAHLTARGAQPGHQVTPARLGRDQHPLAHTSLASHMLGLAGAAELKVAMETMGQTQGIDGQRVVGISAGRHYSIALDSDGQVWTWGACFNGCLGSHNSWISGAQRVDGLLAATLDSEGGVVAIAAGGTFAMAITTTGKVVVWGTPPVPMRPTPVPLLTHMSHASKSAVPPPPADTDNPDDGDIEVSIVGAGTVSCSKALAEGPAGTSDAALPRKDATLNSQPSAAADATPAAINRVDSIAASPAGTTSQKHETTTTTARTDQGVPAGPAAGDGGITPAESGGVAEAGPADANLNASIASNSTSSTSSRRRISATTSSDGENSRTRLEAGVIPGLPRITHIAAGQQHALLSDGQRVWLFGRSLGPDGSDSELSAPWDLPVEVLDTKGAGVRVLRAGSHSSAVVTQTGELWMWGRLLDASHANTLLRRQSDRLWPHRELGLPAGEVWDWAGFGGARPALVTGLSGQVVDVALGGWHALVMVE